MFSNNKSTFIQKHVYMAKLKELSYLRHLLQHKWYDQNVLIFYYMKETASVLRWKKIPGIPYP